MVRAHADRLARAAAAGGRSEDDMTIAPQRQRPIGELLRGWRERRRLSQLDLALQAEISTRHLSFVETGRSRPSREMVLRLAEQLELPLRERNQLLLTAGYAPVYPETALDAPQLAAVRAHLLEQAGEREAARAAYVHAARLTASEPEQRWLTDTPMKKGGMALM